jgi:hypothetical protein
MPDLESQIVREARRRKIASLVARGGQETTLNGGGFPFGSPPFGTASPLGSPPLGSSPFGTTSPFGSPLPPDSGELPLSSKRPESGPSSVYGPAASAE